MKIKTGIIGYGRQGKIREEEINKNKKYELISTADPNLKANYNDYTEMLTKEELDCVFVCVPHSLTTEIVNICLNHGLHVFAEKPPGTYLADVKSMKTTLIKNNVKKLMFGFNHRHYQHIEKAKSILNSKELGKILWMRGIYNKAGLENWRLDHRLGCRGILLGQGIHMLDLFRYVSGVEFQQVKAFVSYHENKYPIEDNVFCILKSNKKITASLHSSSVMWKRTFQLDIGLDNGHITIKGLTTPTHSYGFPVQVIVSQRHDIDFVGNPHQKTYYFGNDNSWKKEVDMFADCIINNKQVKSASIDDAMEVMKLVKMIYNE